MGAVVLDPGVKPELWGVDPALVHSDWDWFWEHIRLAIPLLDATFNPDAVDANAGPYPYAYGKGGRLISSAPRASGSPPNSVITTIFGAGIKTAATDQQIVWAYQDVGPDGWEAGGSNYSTFHRVKANATTNTRAFFTKNGPVNNGGPYMLWASGRVYNWAREFGTLHTDSDDLKWHTYAYAPSVVSGGEGNGVFWQDSIRLTTTRHSTGLHAANGLDYRLGSNSSAQFGASADHDCHYLFDHTITDDQIAQLEADTHGAFRQRDDAAEMAAIAAAAAAGNPYYAYAQQ